MISVGAHWSHSVSWLSLSLDQRVMDVWRTEGNDNRGLWLMHLCVRRTLQLIGFCDLVRMHLLPLAAVGYLYVRANQDWLMVAQCCDKWYRSSVMAYLQLTSLCMLNNNRNDSEGFFFYISKDFSRNGKSLRWHFLHFKARLRQPATDASSSEGHSGEALQAVPPSL